MSVSNSKPRIWSHLGERVRRDFLFQAVAGRLPGVAVHRISGYNPSVDTTLEPIWPGSVQYNYFSDYQPISIVSDNFNDTYGGSGAWVVRILGLDHKYGMVLEDIPLRGLTSIVSQSEYWRVLSAAILKSGTRTGVVGTVTITGQQGAEVVGTVEPGWNIMRNGLFTVPINTTAYLFEASVRITANQDVLVALQATTPVDENETFINVAAALSSNANFNLITDLPIVFTEKTDIAFLGEHQGGGSSVVTCGGTFVLIDNDFDWERIRDRDEQLSPVKGE